MAQICSDAKREKRKLLLDKGRAIMQVKGYNGTGVQEIVDAAQVPKGSFYNYFKSKEDFAVQAIEDYANGKQVQLEELLQSNEKSAKERLILFYSKRRELALKKPIQGCFISNICQEMAGNSSVIASAICCSLNEVSAAITSCIRQGQKDGDIKNIMPAEKITSFIESAYKGSLINTKARCSSDELDNFILGLDYIL